MKIKGTIMVMAFTIFLVVAGLIFDNAYVNSQSNRAGLNEFVTSDGVTLRYQDVGTGQPFVMIPGWSQTAAMWKYQISEFSKNYRVLAIDMRGHGMSDKPDNGYRIQRLSKDVHESNSIGKFYFCRCFCTMSADQIKSKEGSPDPLRAAFSFL